MEPDCRSRVGQSYGSKRRRVTNSVVHTMYLATCSTKTETSSSMGFDQCLLPIEESTSVPCDLEPSDECELQASQYSRQHLDVVVQDSDEDSILNVIDSSDFDSDNDDAHEITFLDKPDIRIQFAEWAVYNNITHTAVGSLLDILKPYHANLPKIGRAHV